jgi:hypothetical protein
MNTSEILFEIPAFIELEGLEVLTFITKGENYAQYNVIGFTENELKLVDYRQKGLEAIEKVLISKRVESFPENFCFPALVRILQIEQEILIELFDPEDNFKPEMMLWIATELQEPIPDYEYSFFKIKPRSAFSYTIVSLFNYYRFQAYFEGTIDQTVLQLVEH